MQAKAEQNNPCMLDQRGLCEVTTGHVTSQISIDDFAFQSIGGNVISKTKVSAGNYMCGQVIKKIEYSGEAAM